MALQAATIEDPAKAAGLVNTIDGGVNTYRYTPINEPNVIRILCLQPGQLDDPLRGTLEICSLDDEHVIFEAISYVWGPPVFPYTILIEGHTLRITESLYFALRTLRQPGVPRRIWADALCIDQSSLIERSVQVTLMRRIYSQCERCLAYLGPEADGSENVPVFMDSIWEFVHSDAWSQAPTWKKGPIFSALPPVGLPEHGDAGWLHLIRFLVRPWFRRLWIIQEVVLPDEVVLYCGDWSMPATDLMFFRLLLAVYKFGSLFDQDLDEATNNDFMKTWGNLQSYAQLRGCKRKPCGIDQSYYESRLPEKLDLRRLLDTSTFCEVTDPRDRFYALLGLADDIDGKITPDYSKTFDQVVQDFIGFLIGNGDGADLLKGVSADVSRLTFPRTQPSWMRKWEENASSENSGNVRPALLRTEKLQANLDLYSRAVRQVSDTSIAIRGFLVDKLSRRTKLTNDLSSEFFDEALVLALVSDRNSSDDVVEEKYHRTLVADCTHNTDVSPAPPEFINQCMRRIEYAHDPTTIYDDQFQVIRELVEPNAYAELALRHSSQAAFGITGGGKFGMFPGCAQEGDQIFMIDGSVRTYLVRFHPEMGVYSWLGSVFVYDLDNLIDEAVERGLVELTVI